MYTFWLVLVTIVWGSTFFIVKETVDSVDEFLLVFIRNIIATIPMLIYAIIKEGKKLFRYQEIWQGSLLGLMLSGTYISQTIGLKFTSTGHSAFITGSAVLFVPFILFTFFRTKLGWHVILSVLITLVGLFFLTYDFETSINIGDLITLFTVIAYAIHLVLAGQFVNQSQVLSLITWQFIFSSLFSLIAFFIFGSQESIISSQSWGALFYLGIAGTLFCYFVSVWAQKYVSAIKVALIFALEPVFAAVFGYFAISEILNFRELSGMIIILGGIILYQVFDVVNEKKAKLNE